MSHISLVSRQTELSFGYTHTYTNEFNIIAYNIMKMSETEIKTRINMAVTLMRLLYACLIIPHCFKVVFFKVEIEMIRIIFYNSF